MKRRSFIKHTTHAIGIPTLLGAFGISSFAQSLAKLAEETDKVLVLIYLQGGNDGLNTVIPLDQLSALNKVRPNVILPENKLIKLPGTTLALHPELPGLKSLFSENRLKIIQSVGYPDQDYSHFRSTDIWMSGSDANELVTSGWPGRYLEYQFPGFPENYPTETDTDPLSIEIGYGSTMLFQGSSAAMSMVIKDPTEFYDLVENIEDPIPNTNAGDKLRHIRLTAKQSQSYGKIVQQAAQKITQQKAFPETDLGKQLKIVSRLIAGGLKTPLYLVRIDGFDTHDEQVLVSDHTKGEHAELLKEVNDGIMAFMNDLEFHGVDDRVTGMTFSEFGRRIVSNASFGTDHGAAAPMFVFGNNVVPGILGDNPIISANSTYKDNLPWQFDFRSVYSSILQQWFELNESSSQSVLLDKFETLPVIKTEPVVSTNNQELTNYINVFPNPLSDNSTVSFYGTGRFTHIKVIDVYGKTISQIYSGKTVQGLNKIWWNTTQLSVGQYIVVIKSKDQLETIKVIKSQ